MQNILTPASFSFRCVTFLLLLLYWGLPVAGSPLDGLAVTYTWTGISSGSSASWAEPTNWLPARIAPQASDILIFDGRNTPAPTVLLDYASAQNIGQLQLNNRITAVFLTAEDHSLTINNAVVGADLIIDPGSTLTVSSSGTTVNGLVLQLGPEATARIAGRLKFDGGPMQRGRHHFFGSAAQSVEFLSGSVFSAQPSHTGNPFGTDAALANTVLFRNGSRYEHLGGSNPFGLAAPKAIVIFEPASYYYFAPGDITLPALTGRTYGTLELKATTTALASTAAQRVTIAGDLIISSGNVALNLNSGLEIKGNLLVNGGSTLTFNPNNPTNESTVRFSGTTPQTLGGTAGPEAVTFGPMATLEVSNAAGITLGRPLVLDHLVLTTGTISTDATNMLTLSSSATLLPAVPTAASFVNGPLARRTVAGAGTTLFPIGRGTVYRPLTLSATAQTAASTYIVMQVEGNPGQLVTAPLQRVSFRRAYTITSSNTASGNFTGTITLSFGDDDYVNAPTSPDLVIARRDGGTAGRWASLGHSAATGSQPDAANKPVSGTLTSAPFSDFSDFTLGALNVNSQDNPFIKATNALPVQLTDFSVQRRADQAVTVQWKTVSEKNSAYFEVQRSLDGRQFSAVALVPAHGTTSQVSSYTVLDRLAPAAGLYYRLRQVDIDGSVNHSPVTTVAENSAVHTIAPYPNPASRHINFSVAKITPYRIINQLGQPLLQGTTAAGTAQVGLEQLAPGLYFLELQTAIGRSVQKFRKE